MFRAPKGTYDVLPGQPFPLVRDALLAPAARAGYGYTEAPVFEDTELFVRGVGESTDVVSKEMFTFSDRGGRSLTLRPEGTAGVLRAALEHGLHLGQLPVKLRYAGPMFRAERPQAGRYRQFQQVGVEALGTQDPALDAEVVALAWSAYAGLGLTRVRLLLTSLGDRACRPAYRERLSAFLAGLDLDEATRERARLNPLRVLDDKRPEVQARLAGAPLMPEALCAACAAHAAEVEGLLSDLGVPFEPAPRLVRGLDYYMRTTFEFVHDGLGAQSAVGGGGRYDGLSEDIGGPPLPGVGWALGVERTLLALEAEGLPAPAEPRAEVFLVPLGAAAKRRAAVLVHRLREGGVRADLAYGDRGLKGAMKAADRSGAPCAVVLGDRDLAAGTVQLKDLRTGAQRSVPLDGLLAEVAAA
ncbi:MAG: histidine--tRNA ligase, partial [Actinomycetota bacterium]|nr:histidine--tRNA ligase [Actinomycetota bacterium]